MEGLFEAGIGEIVYESVIKDMNNFIEKHGEQAFKDATFNGAYANYSYAYIHPCDEMRVTDNFEVIQRAFINAYC
jgi:hypothetical protein